MAIITLSKGTFSGATELAEYISKELGYRLISRENIVEKIAQYGMSEDRLACVRYRQLGMRPRMDLEWIHYLVYARAGLSKEVANATGFSEEEVYDTFEVGNDGKPLSLDTLQNGHDSEGLPPILDTLGKEDSELEGTPNRIDLVNALHCLDIRERNIVYLKFYGGLSQNKIAEHLGISQVHVSRLQRDAVKKLKSYLLR